MSMPAEGAGVGSLCEFDLHRIPGLGRARRASCRRQLRYSVAMANNTKYPGTPDGRYFVVAGRLWRTSNPALAPSLRQELVDRLMAARRQVGLAKRAGDADAEREARAAVDAAKRALGERGPVWWTDGAPDYNRRMVTNTPYADWYAALPPPDGA